MCRAEVEDLRHLADALSAAPRALAALASRRAPNWPSVRSKIAAAPRMRDYRHDPGMRPAFGLALIVILAMASASLFVSPIQGSAFAASGPALAVIRTPAGLTGLTDAPGGATAAAAGSTATLVLGHDQTPAPIPTVRQP
ncbi:MAG: hypothetical protein HY023_06915 [Chloroflexi bacterium]|nr:hypothetical protein [Chloroflexota bacterium]